jgi:hypothetical protein
MPIIIMLCGMLFAAPLWSWGDQDRQPPRAVPADEDTAPRTVPADADATPLAEMIRVHGRVRLVGSMPLPALVISDADNNDWYLEHADKAAVSSYEQRTLTVEGRAEYRDLILANGEKIGVRRFLRDITIIETF